MEITKEKLDSQAELTKHLEIELHKLQQIYTKENKLYRLMLDQYNAEQKLEDYKLKYKGGK